MPRLIRGFAVHMKQHWVLSYPLSTQPRLTDQGRCPGWSEASLSTWSNTGSLATHCVHSQDWLWSGQMPRLIRGFAVHMKQHWVLSYPLSAQPRPWSGPMPRLTRGFAVHMKQHWVLSYPLSAQQRLTLIRADTQADSRLCCPHEATLGL